jgi:hypothetical protein
MNEQHRRGLTVLEPEVPKLRNAYCRIVDMMTSGNISCFIHIGSFDIREHRGLRYRDQISMGKGSLSFQNLNYQIEPPDSLIIHRSIDVKMSKSTKIGLLAMSRRHTDR